MRIRLSKMREQGDMCIYYLYISKRNETRLNRREPTGISNPLPEYRHKDRDGRPLNVPDVDSYAMFRPKRAKPGITRNFEV